MDIYQGNPNQNRTTNQRRPGEENSEENIQQTNTDPTPATRRRRTSDTIPRNIRDTTEQLTKTILSCATTSKKQRRFQRKQLSIVNLSNYKLNKEETKILEKGLNFIPTPLQEHPVKIVQDFLLFERKLRLHHKLYKQPQPDKEQDSDATDSEEESPHKILRPSKGWKPDDSKMDPNILRYKISVLNDLEVQLNKVSRPRYNITKKERQALRSLRTNPDIIIKPADKGGAIVIWKKEDYIKEGEKQLSNQIHYKKLEDSNKTIKKFIKEVQGDLAYLLANNFIDEDTHKILFRKNPRTSNLYLLPKIHKKNNPGRPIINSIGSLTETMSALVDEILRKYSVLAKSYIKDTSHFLQVITKLKISPGDILATVDVTALYTNIPHQDGINKVVSFLRKNGASLQELEIVEHLLNHILKKNYFQFDNRTYLQVSGTAMGTRCAPNYAIIFMAELEEDFLQQTDRKPKVWLRFIDDIFMVWNHGEEHLKKMLEELNNFHPQIKFTEEHNEYGLSFLDTFTFIENRQLMTRVYHKPTDNKQYLHYSSCHPLQQKNAIPYGLLVRARRICTKEDHFTSEAKSIINKLRERKYPEKILEQAVQKILSISREELLEKKIKEEDTRIRYVITYNPSNPKMKEISLKHLHLLARMKRNPINHEKVQIVYRKASNLKSILVSGTVNPEKNPTHRCLPYKDTRGKSCISCDRIIKSDTITKNNNTYKIRGYYNCQSENCVYCLICNCCQKRYIGETSQSVNGRLRGHESHIRNYQRHPGNQWHNILV